ncbi:MAG: FliH/SctL family protein [Clostridium sp.]|nr:FliH/SctL family protein [Clostridium sp.]
MSNIYKPNFAGLGKIAGDPFVIDVNSLAAVKINENNKVIRPVSEMQEENEDGETESVDEKILNETADMVKAMREEASAQADLIIEEAHAEAERIYEAARSEGFTKGLEEGQAEAAVKNEEYLASLKKDQEQLLERTEQKLEEYCEDAAEKLIEFSCSMIKKLTGILVDDYKPVMIHMINEALSGDETGKNIIIKIPEESYAYIYDNKDRISLSANPAINIEIFADAKLKNRQCMIETDNGIIDLSMDIQVNNLITAIKLLS